MLQLFFLVRCCLNNLLNIEPCNFYYLFGGFFKTVSNAIDPKV